MDRQGTGKATPAPTVVEITLTPTGDGTNVRVQFSGLQRLKAQGLLRRAEGQPGLAEERADELGPAPDGPEPAADQSLELVEGGGGVAAQGPFS
jgi:hypothetical protein